MPARLGPLIGKAEFVRTPGITKTEATQNYVVFHRHVEDMACRL